MACILFRAGVRLQDPAPAGIQIILRQKPQFPLNPFAFHGDIFDAFVLITRSGLNCELIAY